jgi:hypothetical protein
MRHLEDSETVEFSARSGSRSSLAVITKNLEAPGPEV